ncbi:MAG: SAM hydroxide adenosyltransferase [Burkholderiales bacterium]
MPGDTYLEIAVNRGSAAQRLGLHIGDEVLVA